MNIYIYRYSYTLKSLFYRLLTSIAPLFIDTHKQSKPLFSKVLNEDRFVLICKYQDDFQEREMDSMRILQKHTKSQRYHSPE